MSSSKTCILVLVQLISKPNCDDSSCSTSRAKTTISNMLAKSETSSAKSRSVKVSFPTVRPRYPLWTVRSITQSIGSKKRSGAKTQPWRTPADTLNHGESSPSTLMQLRVLLYSLLGVREFCLECLWIGGWLSVYGVKSRAKVDKSHPRRSSVLTSCLQDHVESGNTINSRSVWCETTLFRSA